MPPPPVADCVSSVPVKGCRPISERLGLCYMRLKKSKAETMKAAAIL